jgi:hypothetical protein
MGCDYRAGKIIDERQDVLAVVLLKEVLRLGLHQGLRPDDARGTRGGHEEEDTTGVDEELELGAGDAREPHGPVHAGGLESHVHGPWRDRARCEGEAAPARSRVRVARIPGGLAVREELLLELVLDGDHGRGVEMGHERVREEVDGSGDGVEEGDIDDGVSVVDEGSHLCFVCVFDVKKNRKKGLVWITGELQRVQMI